ncbi:hypothetical protein Ahy_A05g024710 isoform A [Arachis hypogaea]|uniref:Uncharacterized protein n=1 Tax=Arachis hypogaea TaxID=3818 RepID=A0A445D6I6_ARAHY|nr:hypothetical protein Ahy_A05g024710 isoform A [Arachis hypogaea]
MAAKPLTTEAIALTEKKMDMTLDDIIKMSKNKKARKQRRVPNKSIKSSNNFIQDKSSKLRNYMDSRSSLRQGALAKRRSNFQGNQFPVAAEIARKAVNAPLRNRNSNRSRVASWNKARSHVDIMNEGKPHLVGGATGFLTRPSLIHWNYVAKNDNMKSLSEVSHPGCGGVPIACTILGTMLPMISCLLMGKTTVRYSVVKAHLPYRGLLCEEIGVLESSGNFTLMTCGEAFKSSVGLAVFVVSPLSFTEVFGYQFKLQITLQLSALCGNFELVPELDMYRIRWFQVPANQIRAASGGFPAKQPVPSPQPQQGNGDVVPKQRPQTLDSLFANMKEQRMRVLSRQNNAVQRNGGGNRRPLSGRGRRGN